MTRRESYDRKYGPEGGPVIRRLIATIAARARWRHPSAKKPNKGQAKL